MKKLLPCFAGLLLGTAVSVNAAVVNLVSLDFETAGQYPNNFRALTGGTALSQTSNGASNDFMRAVNNGTVSAVYDANGSTAGISTFSVTQATPLTISASMSFNVSGNSFGIYIINAANEAQGYLAIFNVNASGTSDAFRFASNAVPTTAGPGSLTNGNFANNADVGVGANSVFNTVSLTYSINSSNNPVLTMTAGSQTSSIAFTSITTPFSSVEIGFRFGAGSGVVGMDNLDISTVSTIPEPSTFTVLAGAAVLGAVVTRRRIVR